MTTRTLQLDFVGTSPVELSQTLFFRGDSPCPLRCVRGKTPGAFFGAGTFQWTAAIRALCLLFVQAKVVKLAGNPEIGGALSGDKGSLASSLDYALSKQPMWLEEMFGVSANGTCTATRLITRTNPNRKRPGPVVLALNHLALSPDNIVIAWEGKIVEDLASLQQLLRQLKEAAPQDFLAHQPLLEEIAA